MHCTNCGAELRPGQKFCVRCGSPAPQPVAPSQPAQQFATPPLGPKRSGGVWVAAAVVLVAIAALLAYRIYHLKHPVEQAAVATAQKPSVELSLPSSAPPAEQPVTPPAAEENAAKPSPLAPPEPQQGVAKHGGRPPEDGRPSILSRRPEPAENAAPAAPPAEAAAPPPTPPPAAEAPAPKPPQPRRPRPSILRPDPSEDAAPPARPSPGVRAESPTERPAMPIAPAIVPTAPYTGPSAGTLVWSGQVEKNTLIRIEGDQVSPGRLTGELPGVPVTIELPAVFAMVEAPSPANHWKRLYVRSLKRVRPGAVIKWSVQ